MHRDEKLEPDATGTAGGVPAIGVQSLQRLTQVGDRFEFVMSKADAYRFTKLGRYPIDAEGFRRDKRYSLFNISSELFNPYYSARFWRDCLRIGGALPTHYFESLTLDLISVNSEVVRFPVKHLVSSWRCQDRTRVAGPQFVSDVSDLFATGASVAQKAVLVRQAIAALIPAHYDLVAVGFELPPSMQEFALSVAQQAPYPSGAHFQVYRASPADVAALSARSLTARLLLSAPGSEHDCFILDVDRVVPERVRFAVFVLSSANSRQHLESSEFWSCALTPLVANYVRTFDHHCLPGQGSRILERLVVRHAAAESAWIPSAGT